jgi:glycerate 2-kinase
VTRYGHGTHCCSIEVIEAGHPLPDEAGTVAASRMLTLVESLTSEDLVIVLVSGGGSALLTLPAPGLTLEQVREVNRRLLASGAPIADINCVRKHLSAITGGRLSAAAWPAEVLTLAISDVPGDDPAVIASGPTVADPSTFADALAVVARYRLTLPEPVLAHLLAGREETPKPGDSRLTRSRFVLAATAASGLAAAAAAARRAGIEPVVLGADIQGEARLVAVEHAELVRRLIAEAPPGSGPLLVLSGGETTVTVDTGGRGGRNAEYLLAFALALEERGFGPSRDEDEASAGPSVYAVAADTDGVDGTEDNAGASLYPDTLARARAGGIDPQAALAAHDSYGVFAALGDVLVTGPTRTNVNDFRGILVV